VAEEARNTTGASKAYSNRRDRKNKYSSGQKPSTRARRQEKK